MTPTDFIRARESLGLSQVGVSRLLEVTDRIVRMWERGERPVPVLVAKVFRLMESGRISVDDVREA